jgi:hypothetical protein
MKTKDQVRSFVDRHGATIAIPANQIALYAEIKGEQLAALSGLVADHAAGFQVRLTERDLVAFAGLASELADMSRSIVSALTADADRPETEGA